MAVANDMAGSLRPQAGLRKRAKSSVELPLIETL